MKIYPIVKTKRRRKATVIQGVHRYLTLRKLGIKDKDIPYITSQDNKRNKWFLGGCDSCGEQKLVRNHKGGKQGNWQKVIVCNECMPEKQTK